MNHRVGLVVVMVLMVLLAVSTAEAQAIGTVVGKECAVNWVAPTTVADGQAMVGNLAATKVNVYVTTTATPPVQGAPTGVLLPVGGVLPVTWGCAGVTPGQHWVWISYSNVNGEGALANAPFVLSTAIPVAPSAVTVN